MAFETTNFTHYNTNSGITFVAEDTSVSDFCPVLKHFVMNLERTLVAPVSLKGMLERGLNLRLDSSVYLYEQQLEENKIEIYEIYRIKKSPVIFQYVGFWSPGQ